METGSRAEYDMRMRWGGGRKANVTRLTWVLCSSWVGQGGRVGGGWGSKQKTEKRAGLAFKGPSQGKKLTPVGFQRSVHVKSRKKPSGGGGKDRFCMLFSH